MKVSFSAYIRRALARLSMILLLLFASGASAQAQQGAWELRVCAAEGQLPYSDRQGQGFENRLAEMVAETLQAKLAYVWLPRLHGPALEVRMLREGTCDLFMGVSVGRESVLTTLAYYRSTTVFVVREDAPFEVASLDDELLRDLRIGVLSASPADFALVRRGMIDNVHHYFARDPLEAVVEAVANEEVEVGIAWGPVAGYFAKQQPVKPELAPVAPQVDVPFLPMVDSIAMGVRNTDVAFRDLLNQVIALRWDDIQALLEEYGVPLLPLPKPTVGEGGL